MLEHNRLFSDRKFIIQLDEATRCNRFTINPSIKTGTSKSKSEREKYYQTMHTCSQNTFKENQNIWYKYWKYHTQANFKIDFQKLVEQFGIECKPSKIEDIYTVFFFHVEMIITILPRPGDESAVENHAQNLCQELESARGSFLESMCDIPQAGVLDPKSKPSGHLQPAKSTMIKNLENQHQNKPSLIWNFLEPWMEKHYESLWAAEKMQSSAKLKTEFKFLLNSIFIISIDKISEKYRNLIPEVM
ncbi:hypothetical protein PTTG_12455 [Puccinia triticina 1-1 BBBD Race 1]|uniref:Uncharacterized protein n=1 Tax=Puccinia triticina (isolate 1-1 / race 1 (BBBD)) TaxID=630390 RepID=A0A180GWZ4_PUCT1|nr:hypothetical protein PTTG_12455 [Puccinia triticina 1-1 BBBD Race 1]